MTPAREPRTPTLSRRAAIRGAVLGAGLAVVATNSGCAASSPGDAGASEGESTTDETTRSVSPGRGGVLLAYFSRPGENYYYGDRIDLETGNTEVLAAMIAEGIDCDVHRIQPADPYPHDYDATVARNAREQDADARPAIANPLPALDGYDIVLLASPIWNVRPPMIMKTFTEALDFEGTTVHPVTTHAMSGLGTAEREYAQACRGATLAEGLAIRGEEVADAGATVQGWLRRTRLARA
ncbi:MAG TPA: flavodoxin [Nocardioidaceae bacterium]|nr:flavodoxin [Nocardioidaceae bacterium]